MASPAELVTPKCHHSSAKLVTPDVTLGVSLCLCPRPLLVCFSLVSLPHWGLPPPALPPPAPVWQAQGLVSAGPCGRGRSSPVCWDPSPAQPPGWPWEAHASSGLWQPGLSLSPHTSLQHLPCKVLNLSKLQFPRAHKGAARGPRAEGW